MLVIFRDFAPEHYIENFLVDVGELKMVEQEVVKEGQENVSESRPSRRANGTWIDHRASDGVARIFRRAVSFLPSVNYSMSEQWLVLKYRPGGHYAPHHDYISYSSPETYDFWMKNYGNRMATFFWSYSLLKRVEV
ncbi:hypothetical protein GCK32_005820 [Trichostrongylus colubriformis]|uniref:Prolyl 4-hydroxylase alpha subunit domain-containing protein n=1 Tax=Trichostrongylus colubriformis TaxID=6319 RepID=A0AAN8IUI9_TRICO